MEPDGTTRESPSVRDLFWLICWPPLPSSIVSKLAFSPTPPSYHLVGDETGSRWTLQLNDHAAWPLAQMHADASGPVPNLTPHLSISTSINPSNTITEVFPTRTRRGNRIACMLVRTPMPSSRYTLLFSHGNAVDLGHMRGFYSELAVHLACDIFSYDYSGYGASAGKPSERNLYADIDAAFQALRVRYGVSPDRVILYGQSIGTVPTVDLAARYECAAVVLHSPLASGLRVLFPSLARTYCFDPFPSIEKMGKVLCPVLVIHGTEDDVVDFSHAVAMYHRCRHAVHPLWLDGAGHNDIVLHAAYLDRLKRFLAHEIGRD